MDLSIFHARLGHSSLSKLQSLDVPNSSSVKDLHCETCVLSKRHKLSFVRSPFIASELFQLVYMDLWGPYKHSSILELDISL